MKNRNNSFAYKIILIFVGLIFLLLNINCDNNPQSVDNEEDRLIETSLITESIVIVKMGSDAITAIKSDKGIIVVDAGVSNFLTAKYRARIEKVFASNKFACLINTHAHHDHTGGNQVFSDVDIIGHKNCVAEMKKFGENIENSKKNYLEIAKNYQKKCNGLDSGSVDWITACCQKYRYQFAANDLKTNRIVTPPNILIEDTLHLQMGNLNLQMIYFGEAHSNSDIIILIPEKKLLFTGDLFSEGGRPFFENKNSQHYQHAINWLKGHWPNIEIIIGGHGQIMSKTDLSDFIALLEENDRN